MKVFEFAAVRPIAWKLFRAAIAKSFGDAALVAAGVAMAIGSIVFATEVFIDGNPTPRVNGSQYLAIFAKPRGLSRPTLAELPVVAAADTRAGDSAIDMTPTGSLGPNATDKSPAGKQDAVDMAPTGSIAHETPSAPPADESYRIVAVEPDMAWLSRGGEVRVVKPGDVVPGLGRVAAVLRREGRWVLADEKGETLLTGDTSETKDLGDNVGPFARRLIFGGN